MCFSFKGSVDLKVEKFIQVLNFFGCSEEGFENLSHFCHGKCNCLFEFSV